MTGGVDRAVRLWDVRSGRSVHKFYGHRVRGNRPGVVSICILAQFYGHRVRRNRPGVASICILAKFYGQRVRRNRPGVASICTGTSFMDIG